MRRRPFGVTVHRLGSNWNPIRKLDITIMRITSTKMLTYCWWILHRRQSLFKSWYWSVDSSHLLDQTNKKMNGKSVVFVCVLVCCSFRCGSGQTSNITSAQKQEDASAVDQIFNVIDGELISSRIWLSKSKSNFAKAAATKTWENQPKKKK